MPVTQRFDMATPQPDKNLNSMYLRVIIGLLSISGTLFSIIGMGILNSLDELKKQMAVNTTGIAVHETKIQQAFVTVASLQNDVRELEGVVNKIPQLFALKPDEVGRRKRYIGDDLN